MQNRTYFFLGRVLVILMGLGFFLAWRDKDWKAAIILGLMPVVLPYFGYKLAQHSGKTYVGETFWEYLLDLLSTIFRGRPLVEMDVSEKSPSSENSSAISQAEKPLSQSNEDDQISEESMASAALKHRLEFLHDHTKRVHDTPAVRIETERAGRGLKISWKMKTPMQRGELVGFRRTGGFFPNEWDESNNGILIIQSSLKSGETTEFLPEGETYFYTFIARPWNNKGPRYLVARFQVTIATKKEEEEIEAILKRFEEKTRPKPDKEQISRALKELGSYVEFDTAFETTAKTLEKQIENNPVYSSEEKKDKLARLRAIMATLREKYQ